MSNRKATFAKRQREMDLKDHAKAKEARRAQRAESAATGKTGKGPEIAWDEQVYPMTTNPDDPSVVTAYEPVPRDDAAGITTPQAPPPAPAPQQPPQAAVPSATSSPSAQASASSSSSIRPIKST